MNVKVTKGYVVFKDVEYKEGDIITKVDKKTGEYLQTLKVAEEWKDEVPSTNSNENDGTNDDGSSKDEKENIDGPNTSLEE